MVLTKQDKEILKILVEKELELVKKDAERVLIVNAPFINKLDDPDLPFLKSEVLYQEFLEKLIKEL